MKVNEQHHVIQRRLQYVFKDTALLTLALTHKSASHRHNERLEFLGDSILNFIIAQLLYQQFENATEGELTRARASLVNKTTLSQVAVELTLGEHIYLGMGEKRSGGFRRESILADAFEAIVGAIYLDSGFDATYQCLQLWFASRIAQLKPKNQEKDPKTRLQEYLQANQKSLPKYVVVSIVGEPHEQMFSVKCEVTDLSLSIEGIGPSRRIAEQIAAAKIWELINGTC